MEISEGMGSKLSADNKIDGEKVFVRAKAVVPDVPDSVRVRLALSSGDLRRIRDELLER